MSDPLIDQTTGDAAIMSERLAAIAARLDEMRADLAARLPLISPPVEDPAAVRDPAGEHRLN